MGLEGDTICDNYFSLGFTSSFTDDPNVDRRSLDVRRIFFDAGLLVETGKNEIKKQLAYMIGYNILKPYHFIKRIFKRINKQ